MPSPYRLLGRTLLPFVRRRISEVTGLEHLPNHGGYIIAPNHQSWMDSPLIAAAIYQSIAASLRFVAQSSKYRLLGGIPINEYDKSRVLDIAIGYLQAGHPVVIFPEGSSNPESYLRRGKTGVARLAIRSGLPIIPVGIVGTRGRKFWPAIGHFVLWWRPIRIRIGQPIQFPTTDEASLTNGQLHEMTAQVMEQIARLSEKPYDPEHHPVALPPHESQGKMFHELVMPLLTFRIETQNAHYLPRHGPFIVAANHPSYFDPPALSLAIYRERHIRPVFPTKPSIAATWKKLVGDRGLHILGMLPINPENRASVVEAASKYLDLGGVVGIFPEGTRNKPDLNPDWPRTMLKAKNGVARIWLRQRVPIVPAGIISPPGLGLAQTAKNFLMPWKKVKIIFGEPIQFAEVGGQLTKDDLDDMTREIMLRIGQLAGQAYPY